MRFKVIALLGLVVGLGGCGGGGAAAVGAKSALPEGKRSGSKSTSGADISKQAAQGYKEALADFLKHDRAYDWAPATCKASAESFVTVSKQQQADSGRPLPEALYNAGLSYMRCGQEEAAVTQFQDAAKAGQGFHRARAQMALFEFKKNGDINRAIQSLSRSFATPSSRTSRRW